MAAGRDPVDRMVDVIMAVPICTWVAARRAVPAVGRAVRDRMLNIELPVPVVDDDEQVAPDEPPLDDHHDDPIADASLLPIEEYDHLAARQVVDRLGALTVDELEAIEQYERANRHRQTVLRKIEQLTS